jgi:mediator of RNA polymerase II transcription subunit 12
MLVSEDSDVLTMVTETMSCNLYCFSVLGVAENFISALVARYKLLQHRHLLTKDFLTSFHELLVSAGTEPAIQQELTHDLQTYDQQYPRNAIARSPISESMDDIFDEDNESNEEINRLWDIGEAVARPDISRLFETTVSVMESTFDDTENQSGIVSATSGLSRLRQFDTAFFDELMAGWIARVKYSSNRLAVFRAFSSFVAVGCLRLEMLAEASLSTQGKDFEGKPSYFGDYLFVSGCLELIMQANPFEAALSVKVCFFSLPRCDSADNGRIYTP